MVKIMMHGCNGVMGQVISKIVEETEGAVMACGVDRVDDGHNDYPVFTDINACDVEVDAIIDFSAAPAVDGLLDFAVERQIPVVLCTTGLSDEQLERVHEASKKTAVLRSANMSLGVNTLFKVLKSMTKLLADAGHHPNRHPVRHGWKAVCRLLSGRRQLLGAKFNVVSI